MIRFDDVLISCEHASNQLPPHWQGRLQPNDALLTSHRGWDSGSLELAERLAADLEARLMVGRYSRLVVDLNRSPHNPRRFVGAARSLARAERERLHQEIHQPYQFEGRDWIGGRIAEGRRVFHVSVHSFTPVLDGKTRKTDIGILYATRRAPEGIMARHWQTALRRELPRITVHRNQPYHGNSDGYVRWLHGQFAPDWYCGLELEVNQRLVEGAGWDKLQERISVSLGAALGR